jgi:hypothetical protein
MKKLGSAAYLIDSKAFFDTLSAHLDPNTISLIFLRTELRFIPNCRFLHPFFYLYYSFFPP